jgi:hypothetical protein
MSDAALAVSRRAVSDAVIVTPSGVLDMTTYRRLHDVLLKAGVDEPRAVVAELDFLVVPRPSTLVVFASAAEQLAEWPGVPLLLVARTAATRRLLARQRLHRFVPVHDSIPAAIAAIGATPPRRVVRRALPNHLTSAGEARRFVMETCAEWAVAETRRYEAMTVVNELVENTLIHTYQAPSVRLELRRDLFTVAVYDDDPTLPPQPSDLARPAGKHPRGLKIVEEFARAWGSTPSSRGGKVVWATLRI